MKKFNPTSAKESTVSALGTIQKLQSVLDKYAAYIGLDTHKDTIMVAIALPGRARAYIECEIANNDKAINKLISRLNEQFSGQLLVFCYEAGPCGYGTQRQITASGHDCEVIAPSKIPNKSGDKVKTDRIDACKLAQYLRSGDLTPIWIPDHEQEAMRDLTRARSDMKSQELKACTRRNTGRNLYCHKPGYVWHQEFFSYYQSPTGSYPCSW